jgi:hypothetical protein
MKANFTVHYGLTFQVEGNDREIFEQIAAITSIFGETKCGKCGCEKIKYALRVVGEDDSKYYELQCTNPECRAQKGFGITKKGQDLFPKMKTKDGKWLQNNGWVIYTKPGTEKPAKAEENARPQQDEGGDVQF